MTGPATLPNKRWLAAREEARAIREGRLTEILEAFPAAPKLKNCLARLLDVLPALSYKVGPHVLVPQILDMATLRKKLKITPAFGQRWGHCAETLTLLWYVYHFVLKIVRMLMDFTAHISVLT